MDNFFSGRPHATQCSATMRCAGRCLSSNLVNSCITKLLEMIKIKILVKQWDRGWFSGFKVSRSYLGLMRSNINVELWISSEEQTAHLVLYLRTLSNLSHRSPVNPVGIKLKLKLKLNLLFPKREGLGGLGTELTCLNSISRHCRDWKGSMTCTGNICEQL